MTTTHADTATAKAITSETAALIRASRAAIRDLEQGIERLTNGQRPGPGLSGWIMGQTALDVEAHAQRLYALLDLSGHVGLVEADLQTAISAGISGRD